MGYCWTWNYIESGSFLFLTLKDKIITFIICGTIFIGMLSIIALVSGTVMKLFGFQYESIGSIILFFIIATIMSFPLNLIAGALPKALYELKRISKLYAFILYLTLDTIATSFGLKHDYDVVVGPMADDTIWDYVEDYMAERISKEAFWELVKFKYPTHQIVFCTEKALQTIKFEGSYSL